MPLTNRLYRELPGVLAGIVIACAPFASSQQLPARADSQIHLDVVVTPKSGTPAVPGLTKQDFTLLDNKAEQPITSFQAVSAAQEPVEVILVIDAVNASYQTIAYERGQIANFLKANGGHLAYPTTLAIFTDNGTQIEQGFSTDGNATYAAFDRFAVGLRTITRSTGIYGADERFQLSMKALTTLISTEAPHPGRKLILWVSPGWPILSGPGIQLDARQQQGLFATIVDLSTQMQRARITLYGVDPLGVDEGVARTHYYEGYVKGVSKPSQVDIGDLSLQALAIQTGGLAVSSTDIAAQLQKCQADVAAYYQLVFNAAPAEKPNEYHAIQVKVARPGMTVRTRDGYYAQP